MKALNRLIIALFWISLPLTTSHADTQKNQIIILKINEDYTVLKAKSAEKKDGFYYIEGTDNKKSVHQAEFFIASLPIHPENAHQKPPEELKAVTSLFDAIIQSHPTIHPKISPEQALWQASLDKRLQADEKKRQEEHEKNLATADNLIQASTDYTEGSILEAGILEKKIQELKNILPKVPERKDQITAILSPLERDLPHLQAGKTFFEKTWKTQSEIDAILEARRIAEIKTKIKDISTITMPTLVVPEAIIRNTAIGVGIALLIALFLIASGFLSIRSNKLGAMNSIEILTGLALIAAIGYAGFTLHKETSPPATTASPDPVAEGTPESTDKETEEKSAPLISPVEEIIYISKFPAEAAKNVEKKDSVTLTSTQINDFLQKHLELQPTSQTSKYQITRSAFQIELTPSSVRFTETLNGFGRDFHLTYDLPYNSTQESIHFSQCEVTLGKTPLPAQIGGYFWKKAEYLITRMLEEKDIPIAYSIVTIYDSEMILKSNFASAPTQ